MVCLSLSSEYRFEMTKAPLLSEEAEISPMIEEKRGTRDIIPTPLLAGGERVKERRGGGGKGDRGIPIGMRRFLRVAMSRNDRRT